MRTALLRSLPSLLACVFLQSWPGALAASSPDAPFPKPRLTAEQALEKATAYISKDKDGWTIVSLVYGTPLKLFSEYQSEYRDLQDKNEWCWFVTYANPKTGQRSSCQITNDGVVHPLSRIST